MEVIDLRGRIVDPFNITTLEVRAMLRGWTVLHVALDELRQDLARERLIKQLSRGYINHQATMTQVHTSNGLTVFAKSSDPIVVGPIPDPQVLVLDGAEHMDEQSVEDLLFIMTPKVGYEAVVIVTDKMA